MSSRRIAVFGGIYNNYLALETAIEDAHRRGAEAIYCLGDLGGFGPHPDRVLPLLLKHDIVVIQGNYDDSIGHDRDDCNCGYTDPRDNHFAQISYDYTARHTSNEFKRWMQTLPAEMKIGLGRYRLHLCHGSPRQVNEFLWESTSSVPFLGRLLDGCDADVILCTHTGLHWHRQLPGEDRHVVNVGVLGRPANDGTTRVWYTMLTVAPDLRVEFVPVRYDHERLAHEMRAEGSPEEFVETILTGWWTTCLEILPAKERAAGRY